jgi:hypothetical protein
MRVEGRQIVESTKQTKEATHPLIVASVEEDQIVETTEQANDATHPSPSDTDLVQAASPHLDHDSVVTVIQTAAEPASLTNPSPDTELADIARDDATRASTNAEPSALPISSHDQSRYNVSVDEFLESLETPIQQPIIQGEFQMSQAHTEEGPADPSLKSAQRKSIRLTKKAEQNVGKDSTQVAHDLLVKKLGDLAGENHSEEGPDFDFYAQHFQRPLEKDKMEAIQTLIEQEIKKKKKKGTTNKKMTAQVGLEA